MKKITVREFLTQLIQYGGDLDNELDFVVDEIQGHDNGPIIGVVGPDSFYPQKQTRIVLGVERVGIEDLIECDDDVKDEYMTVKEGFQNVRFDVKRFVTSLIEARRYSSRIQLIKDVIGNTDISLQTVVPILDRVCLEMYYSDNEYRRASVLCFVGEDRIMMLSESKLGVKN